MSQHPDRARRWRVWAAMWVTAALAAGAATLVPWVLMAARPDDTEALESPLVMAAAGQLIAGPAQLYGPYGGQNPRVLIHAPFYYRLTGLFAWPLVRLGVEPVPATLLVGRVLSMLGFLLALVAVYRLARLGAGPRLGGWWAVLLAAATPIYGGLPFEVRPDVLGIGLQTTGVWIVLASLTEERPERRLVWAFACFGLALCIKQHFVVAPAFSAALLLWAAAPGGLSFRTIALPVLLAPAIAALYYGAEEWTTGGRMSQSVFFAAARLPRIHPADWFFAGNILLALVWKSVGPILLLAAAGSAMVLARPGAGRRLLAAGATGLIGAIALLVVAQLFYLDMRISTLIVAGSLVAIGSLLPACALAGGPLATDRLMALLSWYCALELAWTAVLCRLSTGAWYNYAIEGVIFACVLAARWLARALRDASSPHALLTMAIAALAVPAFALTDAKEIIAKRQADRAALARLFQKTELPPTATFFVDRPGENRVHGRPELVYDPWLYPVFESLGLAEPRSRWLAHALSEGPVRLVVTSAPPTGINGLPRSLPDLGYRLSYRSGPFFVWTRGPRELK
jgi:hypothetical protein